MLREFKHYRNQQNFSRRLRQNQLDVQCNSALIKLSVKNFYKHTTRLRSSRAKYGLRRITSNWLDSHVANGSDSVAQSSSNTQRENASHKK